MLGGTAGEQHIVDGHRNVDRRRVERMNVGEVCRHRLMQLRPRFHIGAVLDEEGEGHETQCNLADLVGRFGLRVLNGVGVDDELVNRSVRLISI